MARIAAVVKALTVSFCREFTDKQEVVNKIQAVTKQTYRATTVFFELNRLCVFVAPTPNAMRPFKGYGQYRHHFLNAFRACNVLILEAKTATLLTTK